MESTLLTVREVAEILKIQKNTVYELVKRGELPASKVGKQVRVMQADVEQYLDSTRQAECSRKNETPENLAVPVLPFEKREVQSSEKSESTTVISGQDVCLELLVNRLSGMGTVLRSYMGCYNSLYELYHGRVTVAAAHLWDKESDSYNLPYISHLLPGERVGVVRLAGRMQGVYLPPGNPKKISGWEDVSRPDVTMINRERGCGTRVLLDQKLKSLSISADSVQGYGRESTSHMAVASIVAKGEADMGFGCEKGCTTVNGVEFLPLQKEWYDLVFRLSDRYRLSISTMLEYVQSGDFESDAYVLGGYDLSQTGKYVEL